MARVDVHAAYVSVEDDDGNVTKLPAVFGRVYAGGEKPSVLSQAAATWVADPHSDNVLRLTLLDREG